MWAWLIPSCFAADEQGAGEATLRLANGASLEGVVQETNREGIVVSTAKGAQTIPWKYFSRGTRFRYERPLQELAASNKLAAAKALPAAAVSTNIAPAKALPEAKTASTNAPETAATITNATAPTAATPKVGRPPLPPGSTPSGRKRK